MNKIFFARLLLFIGLIFGFIGDSDAMEKSTYKLTQERTAPKIQIGAHRQPQEPAKPPKQQEQPRKQEQDLAQPPAKPLPKTPVKQPGTFKPLPKTPAQVAVAEPSKPEAGAKPAESDQPKEQVFATGARLNAPDVQKTEEAGAEAPAREAQVQVEKKESVAAKPAPPSRQPPAPPKSGTQQAVPPKTAAQPQAEKKPGVLTKVASLFKRKVEAGPVKKTEAQLMSEKLDELKLKGDAKKQAEDVKKVLVAVDDLGSVAKAASDQIEQDTKDKKAVVHLEEPAVKELATAVDKAKIDTESAALAIRRVPQAEAAAKTAADEANEKAAAVKKAAKGPEKEAAKKEAADAKEAAKLAKKAVEDEKKRADAAVKKASESGEVAKAAAERLAIERKASEDFAVIKDKTTRAVTDASDKIKALQASDIPGKEIAVRATVETAQERLGALEKVQTRADETAKTAAQAESGRREAEGALKAAQESLKEALVRQEDAKKLVESAQKVETDAIKKLKKAKTEEAKTAAGAELAKARADLAGARTETDRAGRRITEARDEVNAAKTKLEETTRQSDTARTIADVAKQEIAPAVRDLAKAMPAVNKAYKPLGEKKKAAEKEQKKREKEQKKSGEVSAQAPATDAEKSAARAFVERNRKKLTIGGAVGGVLLVGALLGVILGVVLGEDSPGSSAAEADLSSISSTDPVVNTDSGTVVPSPYPQAETRSAEYQDAVKSVAGFFTDIEDKFKLALEKTDYSAPAFKIEGDATIGGQAEKVGIKFNFTEPGAGQIGTPFTPFLVKFMPEDIQGVALDPADVSAQIPAGPAKDLFDALLKPQASFVFMIKVVLLVNAAARDATKTDIEKADFVLDEITKLYSRLILTQERVDSLVKSVPPTLQQIVGTKTVNVFADLFDAATISKAPGREAPKSVAWPNQSDKLAQNPVPLADALDIFNTYYFSKIYRAPFEGDKNYTVPHDAPKNEREAKQALLAVFFRCLKDVLDAEKALNSANGTVEIKTLAGKMVTINPGEELAKICNNSSIKLVQAQVKLKVAAMKLRGDPKNADLKSAYDKAFANVENESRSLFANQVEFRKNFALFMPIRQADGTELTPVELFKKRLDDIKKNNEYVGKLVSKINEMFDGSLGLPAGLLAPA